MLFTWRHIEWHRRAEQPWDCWFNGGYDGDTCILYHEQHAHTSRRNKMSPMLASNVCDGIYSMHISLLPVASPYTLPSHLPTINELDAYCFDFVFTTNAYFSRLVSENRLACWIEISAYLVNIRTNRHTPTQTLANKRSRILGMYTVFYFYEFSIPASWHFAGFDL